MTDFTGAEPKTERVVWRIAIVDDHPVLRRGIVDLLSGHPDLEVCCEASDLPDSVAVLSQKTPDLILLDLMIHKKNALPFLREIKKRPDAPKVIILSLHPESVYGDRALRAGAEGYVSKDSPAEDIVHAIRTVIAGDAYFNGGLGPARDGNPGFEPGVTGEPTESLTERELEVFRLMGLGLGTKQVALELGISAKTVETHQSHLKEKLGLSSGLELARRAILWQAEQL